MTIRILENGTEGIICATCEIGVISDWNLIGARVLGRVNVKC